MALLGRLRNICKSYDLLVCESPEGKESHEEIAGHAEGQVKP